MPLVGGTYQIRDTDDILAFLESELRDEFGEDIDLTDSSAFHTFAESLTELHVGEVESALQDVHKAGALGTAEDENLDRLVEILGIDRRGEIHATGLIEFQHSGTVETSYSISNGTRVTTNETIPTAFETTELVTLSLFDNFESGSLDNAYGGDTGQFSVTDGSGGSEPAPDAGTYELAGPATNNVKVFQTPDAITRGSVFDFRTYLKSNAVAGNLFGVIDTDNYYRTEIDQSGAHRIAIRTTGGGVSTLTTSNTSVPADEWLRNEVTWTPQDGGTITSRLYDSSGTVIDTARVTDEDRIDQGGWGFQSLDGSATKFWDLSGDCAVQANARAVNGGVGGNVGANTLTVLPSVPSGVDSVTNPHPMGSRDFALTDFETFTPGEPEESDAELRERAQISEGRRGKGTLKAVLARVGSLPGAESVTVLENKTNSTQNGLPGTSFELIYYGTDSQQAVADALYDVKGVTAHDYSGANGTAVSETVSASNGQQFTMHWSEPTIVNVDMTLGIVVNSEYVGDDALRDKIVNYIGGTKSDGTSTLGTGVGEDVIVNQVEDVIVGPSDTGVVGVDSTSFTPSTTTDADGLEVVAIGSNEVANTNGEDSSITLNVTQR